MEGPSNGGMLYHEVQESKLCAVHCVNTVLQGPFFSEFDLAALASDLDRTEQQMMLEGSRTGAGDFLSEESHNVSMDGDFSIQVLQKALEVWALQVIPLNSPVAEPAQIDPEVENAFICHLQDHWFCIRKVNGEWYNFDSLYAAPEHLSKFYLSAYLDTLKGFGWSIFLVRGNFPKEWPMTSSEASNGYGQWLLPEDAERIIKSGNTVQRPSQRSSPTLLDAEDDEDLHAAIAASLRDSSPARVVSSPATVGPTADDFNAAIAASLRELSPTPAHAPAPAPAPAPARVEFTSDDLNAAIAASLGDPPPITATSSPGPPVAMPETSSGEEATSIIETKSSPGRNI